MEEKLLKIGQLARLTGVSVKALRYYDRMGILTPAWTDPETGYRYYTRGQVACVDLIRLCLTFELPLRSLRGEAPDLKALILEGQARGLEKLRQGEQCLRLSRDLMEQLERLDRPRPLGEVYRGSFPERHLLTLPWSREGGRDGYLRQLTALHQQAREQGLGPLTQQGLLLEGETARVFLAVERKTELCRTIPAGDYGCMAWGEEELEALPRAWEAAGLRPAFTLCLDTDVYDYCLTHRLSRLEAQCRAED